LSGTRDLTDCDEGEDALATAGGTLRLRSGQAAGATI